ncbi:hypothetical protein AYO47_03600 [Planctomyces sp. SCGC AG-212-M04]|nr:hypothetical protein AYO47_03600 [Planctomyces sp. SCGC AG-212-M04]
MLLTSVAGGRPAGAGFRGAALLAAVLGLVPAIGFGQAPEPTTGSITGVVTDATTGAAVPDAEVRMFPRTETLRARPQVQLTRVRTDASGKYRFENVAPGEYLVYAVEGTRASRSKPLGQAKAAVAADGSSSPVDLKLAEACSLKVRAIAEETGQPIPKALVRLRYSDLDDNAQTDEDGIALIHGLPRSAHYIEVMAPGFQLKELIPVLKAPLTEVRLVLPPGGSMPGTVVDDQGKPVEGVRVTAAPSRGVARYDETTSDKDGKFVLNYLPTLQPITIFTSMTGYDEVTETFSLNTAPDHTLELKLRPRLRGGDVEVTVVDAAGRPIVGAEVINYGHPRTEFQQTQTDESGRASLTKLLPPFRGVNPELTFRAQGFAPKGVKLSLSKDGPAKTTVSMEKGHHFRGRVVNGAGEPISGATVFTMDGNRGGYNGHQMMLAVDRDGRFSSTTAVPESSLFLEADGYTGLREQKVVLDQEEEQVFTLDGLGHLRGIVVDAATRRPVRTFRVRLDFAGSSVPEGVLRGGSLAGEWIRPGRTIIDDAGRFLWEDLPNNSAFDVTVEADGYEPLRLSPAVTHRDDTDLHFELKPIDPGSLTEVAGVVLDEKGNPIKGIEMHLIGIDPVAVLKEPRRASLEMPFDSIRRGYAGDSFGCRFDHATVTAADGRFRFPKVTNSVHLQLAYWGPGTPPTRTRDLEKQPADRLRQIEISAAAVVTVKGKINLDKYLLPERIMVQVGSAIRDQQSVEVSNEDPSQYTITNLAPGELKVTLMSDRVERREKGSVSWTYRRIVSKNVSAKSGETVEVNFD